MNSVTYFSGIKTYLANFAVEVSVSNSLSLHNDAKHSENFLCDLLKNIYGWNLENANRENPNQDTYDLTDAKGKFFVQVTSTKSHSKKYRDIEKKLNHRDAPSLYKSFAIVFISNNVKKNYLEKKTINGITYEGYDLEKILAEIFYRKKTAGTLKPLYDLLQDEFSPLPLRKTANVSSDHSYDEPKQTVPKLTKGVAYIKRQTLVEAIFEFSQKDNGLVTGGPGYGKSFIIEELQRLSAKKKVLCFVIRINELLNGSEKEIEEELGISTHWIKSLKRVKSNPAFKSILVFDAFDTAKEDGLKEKILKYIRSALKDLGESWSVIVSARTFDAKKSFRLQELFPKTEKTSEIECRFLEIPELNQGELEDFLVQTGLHSLYNRSTPTLKSLLKTPYFLKLFGTLFKGKRITSKSLQSVETEEQLLSLFWDRNITDSTQKDIFVRKLTSNLITKENLSCLKSDILNERNSSIFDNLISQGIIIETSVSRQNISYSHNILLDFAISKYSLSENPDEFIAYIESSKRQPFIFRVSFIYFFSRLWNRDRNLFWQFYFQLKSISTPLFRLVHQTILNYVLGASFNDVEDLKPVFKLTGVEEKATITRKILEGIRFISNNDYSLKEIKLFLLVCKDIHLRFIWELGVLINKSIEQAKKEVSDEKLQLLSQASRNYLQFILSERKFAASKYMAERNGGHWGVENFFKTYEFQNQPKTIIQSLLNILKEVDFPITFFHRIADNIAVIAETDFNFAVKVYKTLYFHVENNDTKFDIGGSVLIQMKISRRQNYESIHHQLETDFAKLLRISPAEAIALGVEVVNRFLFAEPGYWKKESPYKLHLNNDKRATLINDHTIYDFETEKDHGPLSHLKNVLEFLTASENAVNSAKLSQYIHQYMTSARASTLWIEFLKFLSNNTPKFKRIAYSFLTIEAFLICEETSYHALELLRKYWSTFNRKEQKAVETFILRLDKSKYLKGKHDLGKSVRQRILCCIPEKDIQVQETIDFFVMNPRITGAPKYNFSRLESFEEDDTDKMARLGINPAIEVEKRAFELTTKLESFNYSFGMNPNNKPPKNEYVGIFDEVRELFELRIKDHVLPDKLMQACDYEITTYSKITIGAGKELSRKIRSWIKETALFYVEIEKYKTEYEKEPPNPNNRVFSSNPRIHATELIVSLLYLDKEDLLASRVVQLISDNTQAIRLRSLKGLIYYWNNERDVFWTIFFNRLENEDDSACLLILLKSISSSKAIEEEYDNVEKALTKIARAIFSKERPVEMFQKYAEFLLHLYINFTGDFSKNLIYQNFSSKEFCKQLLLQVAYFIDLHSDQNNYAVNPNKNDRLLTLINDLIAAQFDIIKAKSLDDPEVNSQFEIIDLLVQELNFTIITGRKDHKGKKVSYDSTVVFFQKIKPAISLIIDESKKLGSGFMVAHTGYYFIQLLNFELSLDPEYILAISADIVSCAEATGFTYDSTTLKEVITLTEKIFADHKIILKNEDSFNNLLSILDHFANSGWQEALELTWRLKEIF